MYKHVLFFVCLLPAVAFAQIQDSTKKPSTLFKGWKPYRTLSVGVQAGGFMPVTYTGGTNDFSNWDAGFGYGATVRKQVAHSFGVELAVYRGTFSGNNKSEPQGVKNDLKSYDTELPFAATLMGVANIATIDFLRKKNWINFLVKAGYGHTLYSYKQTFADGTSKDFKGSYDGKSYQNSKFVPAGVGVKFKISNHLNFDLGYTMMFIDRDDLDGLSQVKTSNDKFAYGYSGIELSLGKATKENLDWLNPIGMMYDELKDSTIQLELAALKKRMSAVETGLDNMKIDSDKDGVADYFDKCPNTPPNAIVSGAGCPLDTDQDSVPDYSDRCPLEKGPVANNGCPVIAPPKVQAASTIKLTAEEQQILQDVFENLEFETGKYIIRSSSFPSLDKLAKMMITKPNYRLKISGHTDDVGSEKSNQLLSVNRANAVKNYLVKNGVIKNRIEARGYGESQPVASNATPEGRQQNRRVEFNIF